ncbi:hypothetical protein [Roseimicrobium sp. ORNL1]|uniref:hypothetical protein n=1 Tax=Roseimicrobium sp. ORNL1 TaxID=2711231 RepID=UPI0013E0F359|nr:hypothetical protein [Roseimicrobium sp. ORNL1]QIF01670.1 hypothetical protein G5S37_09090 [Roseimicrobium sp. ORNL1]
MDTLINVKSGRTWKSTPLKVRLADGSEVERLLVMEFAPGEFIPGRGVRPSDAMVHLLLEKVAGSSSSSEEMSASKMTSGGFRDVNLQQEGDVRTMIITRSPFAEPGQEDSALKLFYKLKDGTLVLRGFSKVEQTNWGELKCTLPSTDLTFHVAR